MWSRRKWSYWRYGTANCPSCFPWRRSNWRRISTGSIYCLWIENTFCSFSHSLFWIFDVMKIYFVALTSFKDFVDGGSKQKRYIFLLIFDWLELLKLNSSMWRSNWMVRVFSCNDGVVARGLQKSNWSTKETKTQSRTGINNNLTILL